MERIKGLKLEKIDLTLNKKGDFLFYEGPILSHFYDDNGNDYLMLWIDSDTKNNKWLLFKIERIKLYEYLIKSYSLRAILELNYYELVYFIDINNEGEYKNILLTIKDNIPENYLPSNDSFFDEDYSESYAVELRNELSLALVATKQKNVFSKISKLYMGTEDRLKRYKIFTENNIVNSESEIITLKSTEFPIYVHYQKQKNYKYLLTIYQSAFTNPTDLNLYFAELDGLLSKSNEYAKANDVSHIFERLIESTIVIIRENPTIIYNNAFVLWKKQILSNPHLSHHIYEQLNNLEL